MPIALLSRRAAGIFSNFESSCAAAIDVDISVSAKITIVILSIRYIINPVFNGRKFIMQKYILVAVMAIVGLGSTSAKAANPYSDCGIGAAIFSKNSAAAAISNVIWDLGSTAVTSATLSPETCSGEKVDTAKFILESIDNLESDVALGKGEHVDALASLMQCDGGTNLADMTSTNYSSFVSSEEYQSASNVTKASAFYDVLKASDTKSCKTIL